MSRYGTLKKLREMGMKDVGFGMTVQDKNAPDLVPLYKISDEMGMEFATASLHNSFYFVEAKNIIHDRPMVAKNFENLINELLRSNSPKKWFRAYFNHGLINYIYGQKRLLPCDMSFDTFFIDPYGDVMPCNGTKDKEVMVPNYQIDGKTGTWLPYDSEVVEGVCFFMMRNEQRKDAVSPVVVDSKGVFVTDAPNGFENVRSTLTEYVQRAEKKQQDMTEHEKCLTNGTYERARESGTEQNYDMIDGCVNNVPKKPRRIGGRWSVLDRLHIKQAQRKQKDQTQQQQQERSRKN